MTASGKIVNDMKIVVVGGVAGGASFAARARRLSERAKIVVIEKGPYVSFANCGLPYHVGGEIADRSRLLLHTPESLRRRFNLDVRVRSEVVRIDRKRRIVTVRDGGQNSEYEESYDHLVLATGAAPVRPAIPGIDAPGIHVLRDVPDMDRIIAWVDQKAAKRAVVVGGGYVGLEMVEQLHRRGLAITLIEALDQVMAPLDAEMAALLRAELMQQGVGIHLGDAVAEFAVPNSGEQANSTVVVTKGGLRIPADVVLVAIGVRPESSLARDAGLATSPRGSVQVNEFLQTSDPHIWAVGDVIEVTQRPIGTTGMVPLAGPANRQGRIVADNIVAGMKRKYRGTFGTAVLRLFDLTAACTGANEKALRQQGKTFKTVFLHPNHHASYFPGAQSLAMKLLFSPLDRRLLGAQIVGKEGVDKRIDVFATALFAGMTVDDLAELELAYAPPFGSAKDPINLAGMAAQNVLDGLVDVVQWHELPQLLESHTLLDVRDSKEVDRGSIPQALHIPLDELRARVGEIPPSKPVVVYCQSGQRSYTACRILSQLGIECRNLSGAYKTWQAAQS